MSIYNPIMVALLNLLQTNCGATFKTYSRRLITWEALTQAQNQGGGMIRQPAIYVFDGMIVGESGTQEYVRKERKVPSKRIMDIALVIYAQLPGSGMATGIDATTPGADIFYPLLESVESALEPSPSDPNGAQTLNGTVAHCWIEGKRYMVPGDIDPNGQGMAILPVKILIP